MKTIWKTPRLDKIDPKELGKDVENRVISHLAKFDGPKDAREACAGRLGQIVTETAIWCKGGKGSPVGFESVYSILTTGPLGLSSHLPSDPDRWNDDMIGRLALLRLAHEARCALLYGEPMSVQQIAVLASLSVRGVRDLLAHHRSEDRSYPNHVAREFLKAHEVTL